DLSIGQMMTWPGIDGVEQRHPDIVDEVQRMKRLWQLKAARQSEPGAFMRDQPVERAAVERHRAGLVAQRAAQTIDQRALARAVRTDQPDPLAGGDRQIDALERDKPAEALAERADREQRAVADIRRAHAAALCSAPASIAAARRRRRACTSPTM